MKRVPALPLAWGAASIVALLVILSVVVLVTGQRIERQAWSLQTDSVPGLVDSHAIRTSYSEGFVAAAEVLGTDTALERQVLLQGIAKRTATGLAACDDYLRTIHVDLRQDMADYHAVLQARDDFLQVQAQFVALVESGRAENSQRLFLRQLTPSYHTLMAACDRLVDYNGRTGTAISTGMLASVAHARWTVIAVIGLGLIASVSLCANLLAWRKAETALRDSERKFSAAFHSSPYSMTLSNPADGRIIDTNEAFKRQNGLVGREVVGKTTVELGVWASVAEREAMLRLLNRDGRVNNFLREGVLPNGKKTSVLISVQRIRLGEEDCMLSSGNDITELVSAQQALARSGEELRVIFDNAVMGIALVMPDGRPIRCNSALERMLGYSSEEIAAMSFAQFTHPDDVERERQQFQEVMEKDLNFYQGEMRYRRKDGATVWGSLTVSIVRGEDGKMAYGVRMLEDVSEQKSAELALRESEAARQHLQDQLIVAQKLEAVGQLAGGVAHDFNNILAAIMLHLDLLKSESAISPGRLDSIDELIMASRRAAGLTRQLLLFSRREPAQRRVVDLNVIVSNLLKMLDRLVGEHLTLVHEATPQALWLLADPGMLEQVVMNLVVNARDAMPGGGRIVLRAEAIAIDAVHAARQRGGRAGPFIRLAVIDKGGGMSADTQARIFEPFFTTKEAGKGTGLGLSTVFGIVQQHAGWIEVESAEGMGSSFAIYLPAHTGPVVDQIPERAAVPVAKGYETILIAEDNEGLRLAAVKILRRSGYDVLEAADGRSARAILDARPGEVDLLLTDVVMPGGLMGHELAAGLRTAGSPKVILMSGYTTNVDRATLEAAGHIYLAKPFDSGQLLQIVRETLGRGAAKTPPPPAG